MDFCLRAEGVVLDLEEAVPCGLIIMECVSNALIHAFPDNEAGNISVSAEAGVSEICIKVLDSGKGFPEGWFSAAESLGFQMIHQLTQQLGGRISYIRDGGSRFSLLFPKKGEKNTA